MFESSFMFALKEYYLHYPELFNKWLVWAGITASPIIFLVCEVFFLNKTKQKKNSAPICMSPAKANLTQDMFLRHAPELAPNL